jgi:hypothetical protein
VNHRGHDWDVRMQGVGQFHSTGEATAQREPCAVSDEPGVDGQTWAAYGEQLDANFRMRMHGQSCYLTRAFAKVDDSGQPMREQKSCSQRILSSWWLRLAC